jgi:hypothetical protein
MIVPRVEHDNNSQELNTVTTAKSKRSALQWKRECKVETQLNAGTTEVF